MSLDMSLKNFIKNIKSLVGNSPDAEIKRHLLIVVDSHDSLSSGKFDMSDFTNKELDFLADLVKALKK
jgi:hypothetical protein